MATTLQGLVRTNVGFFEQTALYATGYTDKQHPQLSLVVHPSARQFSFFQSIDLVQ